MRPRARHGTAVDSGQRNNTTARLCFLPLLLVIPAPRALVRCAGRFCRCWGAGRLASSATAPPRALGIFRLLPPRPARVVALRCCVRVAWCRRARLGAGLACLPRLVFALSGPQLVHWYGGGSSFTPPPDLKLSSRFFFLSCDQAKKKRERKQSLAPCSSNIIRFVVVDSTAQYSRKKAIDFASRTGQHI